MHLLLLAVHPHIRGAYHQPMQAISVLLGSSPHTWGIQTRFYRVEAAKRFIPTYVGHTRRSRPGRGPLPVHPHIRGAYLKQEFDTVCNDGSSPHTWGIRPRSSPVSAACRFIPTYVGHTPAPLSSPFPPAVHPHIRGAYGVVLDQVDLDLGSSPHTWGIRGRRCNICCPGPVHPHIRGAYVCGRSGRFPPRPVHPHIRGAYEPAFFFSSSRSGSSPHTWGIQRLQISTGQLLRFIPTYVGHTRAGSPPILRRTVHPHIRGAYSGSGKSRSLKNGSSPHTWGIPQR